MQNSIDDIGKVSKLEYIIMFLLICISGNPIFIYTNKYINIIFVALLFIICLVKNKKLSNTQFLLWLIGSCFLFLLQNTTLELISIKAEVNFLARLYIAFLSISFFGYRFREIYFRTMVFISVISLPFFILQLCGIKFGYAFDRYISVVLYNFTISERNPGMFWEPGAFQGFIMLVPLLFSDKLYKLCSTHKKGCILLLLALITTKSTTGYLAFGSFIFLIVFFNKRISVAFKGVVLSFFLTVFIFAWSQDFMGEKIMKQNEEMQTMQANDVYWDRLGVMVLDFHHTARHPIIGNGFELNSRYGYLGEYMTGVGNGLSGAFNMFGFPFIILYFIGIYRNNKAFTKTHKMIFITIIAFLLSGEYFLNYPLFWSLLFIKLPKEKNN